jgi:hypothetical protein
MCDRTRKKTASGEGYSNLMQHLNTEYETFEEIYAREKALASAQIGGMLKYLTKQAYEKTGNIWGWIDWIVEDNLPFDFVESDRTKQNSKLTPISEKTLKKYMIALLHKVEGKIGSLLKHVKSFGLITDGWTLDSEHYMAIFATFVEKNSKGNDVRISPILQYPR